MIIIKSQFSALPETKSQTKNFLILAETMHNLFKILLFLRIYKLQ